VRLSKGCGHLSDSPTLRPRGFPNGNAFVKTNRAIAAANEGFAGFNFRIRRDWEETRVPLWLKYNESEVTGGRLNSTDDIL
jgi:hypothetical protein